MFNPVANGLKAIEGLEGLGEGVDQINGLSTKALHGLASATKEALAAAGKVRKLLRRWRLLLIVLLYLAAYIFRPRR